MAGVKGYQKQTMAICPKCKTKHKVKAWITGKGPLFRYCFVCLQYKDKVEGEVHGRTT